MVDIHTHILPGIDDGPDDLAGAVELGSAFVEAGIDRVVATPHVNSRWGLQVPAAKGALEETRSALRSAGLDLRVESGAELALTTAVDLDSEQLASYRLGDGEWLLLEPPSKGPSASVHSMIFQLMSQGHRVLLAHPERSQAFQEDPELLSSLVSGGLRTQVTAGALTGNFGRTAQRAAEEMFKRGLVHVVASDAHHAENRPPSLVPELESAGHKDMIRYLCQQMPTWILDGGKEPARPERADAKPGSGFFARFVPGR